jgi:hypothetical protein
MSEKTILKPYKLTKDVQAVRITRDNLSKLKEIDTGEGVLDFISEEELIGEWYVVDECGAQILSKETKLRRIKQ